MQLAHYEILGALGAGGMGEVWREVAQGEMFRLDLRGVVDSPVPFFVVQGTEDDITPAALSRAYVKAINAPQKAFIPIEGAGHSAVREHAREFLAALNEHLGPIIATASPR